MLTIPFGYVNPKGGLPIPRDELVAEYMLNNSYLDTSGNSYNLGLNTRGAPTLPEFQIGRKGLPNECLRSYFSTFANVASLSHNIVNLAITDFSFSLWLNVITNAADENAIFSINDNGAVEIDFWPIRSAANSVLIRGGSTEYTGLPQVTPGWKHWVHMIDSSGNLNIYIDNVNVENSAIVLAPALIEYIYLLSRPLADWGFNGQIQQARLYSRILTVEEIAALYNE